MTDKGVTDNSVNRKNKLCSMRKHVISSFETTIDTVLTFKKNNNTNLYLTVKLK